MKSIILAALILAAALPQHGFAGSPDPESDALDKAEVRIPYTELKKLWDAARQGTEDASKAAKAETPPTGTLLRAHLTAAISNGLVTLEAEFTAESFTDKWEKVRLMDAGLSVATVDPPDTRLVVDGDDLCLLAKGPGTVTVKLRFVPQTMPTSLDAPFLNVANAPSAVAALDVRGLPEGRGLKLPQGPALKPHDGIVTLALPAKGGEVSLALADLDREPKPEPPPPPLQPSEWSLQNEVLVFEGEGELAYRIHAHIVALNGSALEATLLLPPNARNVKVDGADLEEGRVVRNAEGLTEMRLRWRTRDLMERDLKLAYTLQQLPLALVWDLRAPSLAKDDKVKTLFMCAQPRGMEFGGASVQAPVPAARLPRWIAEETKATEFGTLAGASSGTLQSKLLPRLETAAGIVTRSEYTTRLVSDGSVITEAMLEIEHQDAMRWSFTLPDKSELLKCSLNGIAVQPIVRDKGVMEIPLEGAPDAKAAHSILAFSYTATRDKLDPVEGQAELALPLTPLFINEVRWTIEIPDTYEVTGVEGNVTPATGSSASKGNLASLIKSLCRNERPQAQIFYRRHGLE